MNTSDRDKKARPHIGRLLLGITTVLLGIVFVPLPVPLGWLFLLVGIALIALEIAWVGSLVRWCRSRWGWGDRRLRQLHGVSPILVKEFLDNTDPNLP